MSKSRLFLHRFLVIAQFMLAAAIVLTANGRPPDGLAILLATPGALIAIWAWLAMGLSRIRVGPAPGERTELVRRGPYRVIRHPMYSGLLLLTGGPLFSHFGWWRLAAWGALLFVLVCKSQEEERLLQQQFDAYADYRRHTAGFFPGVY